MSVVIRVVKGYTSAVTLPGALPQSAALEYDGETTDLEISGNAVIIRDDQIQDVPVAKVLNADYECTLVVNGDTRIPCYVVANPIRPRL